MNKTEKLYESVVLVFFVVLFSYFLYIAKTADSYSFDGIASMDFPSWIFMLVIGLSGIKLVVNVIRFIKNQDWIREKMEHTDRRVFITLVMIILYAFAWNVIGFSLSTFIFVSVVSKVLRKESPWMKSVLLGVGTTVVMMLVFGFLFSVDFPEPLYALIFG